MPDISASISTVVCIRGKTGSAVSVPLTLQVLIVGEQVLQPVLLLVGEQVGAGVQGPADGVERVAVAATATAGALLDPAAALVEGVIGQARPAVSGSKASGSARVRRGRPIAGAPRRGVQLRGNDRWRSK